MPFWEQRIALMTKTFARPCKCNALFQVIVDHHKFIHSVPFQNHGDAVNYFMASSIFRSTWSFWFNWTFDLTMYSHCIIRDLMKPCHCRELALQFIGRPDPVNCDTPSLNLQGCNEGFYQSFTDPTGRRPAIPCPAGNNDGLEAYCHWTIYMTLMRIFVPL